MHRVLRQEALVRIYRALVSSVVRELRRAEPAISHRGLMCELPLYPLRYGLGSGQAEPWLYVLCVAVFMLRCACYPALPQAYALPLRPMPAVWLKRGLGVGVAVDQVTTAQPRQRCALVRSAEPVSYKFSVCFQTRCWGRRVPSFNTLITRPFLRGGKLLFFHLPLPARH